MDFDFFKHFRRNADDQMARLQDSQDPRAAEIDAMASLIHKAYGADGIEVSGRIVDDSHTAVSAAVAHEVMLSDPEQAARMAWAAPELGR